LEPVEALAPRFSQVIFGGVPGFLLCEEKKSTNIFSKSPQIKDASWAKEGQVERVLKRKLVRERKAVARELRRDGQFLAESRDKEKAELKGALRKERRANFSALEAQQGEFNAAVKHGMKVKGAGVGGLNLKGRRMGTRE